jgi:hypothetical protein
MSSLPCMIPNPNNLRRLGLEPLYSQLPSRQKHILILLALCRPRILLHILTLLLLIKAINLIPGVPRSGILLLILSMLLNGRLYIKGTCLRLYHKLFLVVFFQ